MTVSRNPHLAQHLEQLMLMHSFAKVAVCQKMKQFHLLGERPFRYASRPKRAPPAG